MFLKLKWAAGVLPLLAVLALGCSLSLADSCSDNIKKAQEALRDRGYDPGPIDGHMGHRTRSAILEYQKAENLPLTGHLDSKTADQLGVGPESVGGNLKGAGKEVKEGTEKAGHEIKEGKPVAAGKEMGKGVGRAGKKVGKAAKEAVDPDSRRADREKEKEKEHEKEN